MSSRARTGAGRRAETRKGSIAGNHRRGASRSQGAEPAGASVAGPRPIESAVASKRYEQTLMSFLPCGILLYLQLISPGFLEVLYTTALGAGVMTVCLAIYIAAVLWGRRIVDIRV